MRDLPLIPRGRPPRTRSNCDACGLPPKRCVCGVDEFAFRDLADGEDLEFGERLDDGFTLLAMSDESVLED